MTESIKQISTSKLLEFIKTKQGIIFDLRPVDAFNGWRMENEHRGGHIKTAKSLPFKWTNYMDWIEVVHSKKVMVDDEIVLYGYSKGELEKTALMFEKAGFKKPRIYTNFKNEWSANHDLPMENLKRFEHLVYADWVNQILKGESPPKFKNKNVVICHAHYRNRDAYLSGHIPDAIDLDTLALESPETWNRRSPEELKTALLAHGITSDTTVILYGKFMSPDNDDPFPGSAAGHIGAIRCAFIMLYAGVKDVRVLNGGFQSWEDEGFEVSTADVAKKSALDFGVRIPQQPNLVVDIEEAKTILKSSEAELVCVRSLPEYLGEVSGYNYIKKTGRIPGAVFGNCGSDAYHMENYRNPDHTIKDFHEVAQIWKDTGLTPDKHLAFYCGTGWRGSEAFFNAWLMGWPNVSVFDGGWFEWSKDPLNPIENGQSKQVEKVNYSS